MDIQLIIINGKEVDFLELIGQVTTHLYGNAGQIAWPLVTEGKMAIHDNEYREAIEMVKHIESIEDYVKRKKTEI
jgi:hypothetical protein